MSLTAKKRLFTLTDFEKGLMLAGFIAPANDAELEERELLENYEENQNKTKGKVYFKRAVLAAEIAHELHVEPTFGRIKFQKLVYLCENAAHMNLESRYRKQAAGPFDNKFMHSINQEFEKQKWFEIKTVNDGIYNLTKYTPLPDCNKYKIYYSSYFKSSEADISRIINLFRKQKTDFTEIAATLFACWLEIKSEADSFTEDDLLSRFYKWSERKKKYDKSTVLKIWAWLIENNFVDD